MKVGDVVHLHSGGTNMTISHIGANGRQVTCQWFEGATLHTKNFQRDSLVILDGTSRTHVIQVMDGSGSMERIWDEIQGMLRKQWEIHQGAARDGQDIRITTLVFDDEIYPPVLRNVNPLQSDFPVLHMPGGMTALRDAVGQAIKLANEKFGNGDNEAVLVQIFTDGAENRSREWTHEGLASEIKRLQDTGKWTFQFFGADQIAERTAMNFNIPAANAIRFHASARGVKGMSSVVGQSVGSYYSARAQGETSVVNSFGDGDEKEIAEDGSVTSSSAQT